MLGAEQVGRALTERLENRTGSVPDVRDDDSRGTGLPMGSKPNNSVSTVEQTMMIQRALYVLVAVTALVVVYFVVRTIRMRRINRKNWKYGILNTNLENVEMRPLDQDDDDEDDTLFDVHHSRR
ncbi:membrane protein FAM174A-like isoform X2 [Heterodontus francisci]